MQLAMVCVLQQLQLCNFYTCFAILKLGVLYSFYFMTYLYEHVQVPASNPDKYNKIHNMVDFHPSKNNVSFLSVLTVCERLIVENIACTTW